MLELAITIDFTSIDFYKVQKNFNFGNLHYVTWNLHLSTLTKNY